MPYVTILRGERPDAIRIIVVYAEVRHWLLSSALHRSDQPSPADDSAIAIRQACGYMPPEMARRSSVRSRTYEITFTGQAGATLRAEFDDCDVTVGGGTTTLRAELPDEAALGGLIQRITSLRLEVIDVHLMTPPPPVA